MLKNDTLKLTPRSRHAVMAIVELAKNEGKGPMPLARIANAGDISLSYLEQLFAGLRKRGLVRSHRGPGGGYVLAKPSSEIYISEILLAAEEGTHARKAEAQEASPITSKEAQSLWTNIGQILHVYLRRVSLADILAHNLENHPVSNKIFETLR